MALKRPDIDEIITKHHVALYVYLIKAIIYDTKHWTIKQDVRSIFGGYPFQQLARLLLLWPSRFY